MQHAKCQASLLIRSYISLIQQQWIGSEGPITYAECQNETRVVSITCRDRDRPIDAPATGNQGLGNSTTDNRFTTNFLFDFCF